MEAVGLTCRPQAARMTEDRPLGSVVGRAVRAGPLEEAVSLYGNGYAVAPIAWTGQGKADEAKAEAKADAEEKPAKEAKAEKADDADKADAKADDKADKE